MKLYATLENSERSRQARKGSDEQITIGLTHKNKNIATIEFRAVAANGWVIDIWSEGERYHREVSENLK